MMRPFSCDLGFDQLPAKLESDSFGVSIRGLRPPRSALRQRWFAQRAGLQWEVFNTFVVHQARVFS